MVYIGIVHHLTIYVVYYYVFEFPKSQLQCFSNKNVFTCHLNSSDKLEQIYFEMPAPKKGFTENKNILSINH